MISIFRITVALSAMLCVATAARGETVIQFDDGFMFLPYTENGLTFIELPGSSQAVVSGGTEGELVSGTGFDPIRIRVTGDSPFDLVSMDIEQIFRSWRFVSSSGAVVMPTQIETLTFDNLVGWDGITSFDMLHDPAEANGSIRVDNITVRFVPEPTAFFLAICSLIGVPRRRCS